MKWSEEKLRTKISAAIREQRQAQGLDPDVRPTQQWLRENGYSGIEGFARRNDMSVVEVLENICGFTSRPQKPLGIEDPRTRRLIEKWLDAEKNIYHQWSDRRIEDSRTHFRTLAEIADEELGSTDLLRIVRADSGASVRMLHQLFAALGTRLETEGAQSNYSRSLERWGDYLALLDVIDGHKISDVRSMMGYTFERRSPDHNPTPPQIRACLQSAETLEEKTLIILLCGAGVRRSEPVDLTVSQLHLDRADPHIRFGEERKSGPAATPIMAGVDIIEAWIDHLEELDHWDGRWLFPSKKSRDGSRSGQWVNDTIDRIVENAGVTFTDGTKFTPKTFRAFWYEHYSAARQEWLTQIEHLADEQGVSSAEVISLHYMTDKSARDHFRKFARSYFAAVFGEELVHGLDDVTEARDSETDGPIQSAIGDYVDSLRDEFTDDGTDSTYDAPAATEPISAWVRTRLRTEHAAAAASDELDHYPLSARRAAGLAAALGAWIVVFGILFGVTGTFIFDPFSGEITATPGAILGIALLLPLLIAQTPDLGHVDVDPPQVASD